MKRLPGKESTLLRQVLKHADNMLKYYNLRLSYTVDVPENSYTVQILPEGLDSVGVLMRLQRYERFQSILEDIVAASDTTALGRAVQRARCELDPRAPYAVEDDRDFTA